MKRTNFDEYLDDLLDDPAFAARYKKAGMAWDVALQITALREKAGLSQKQLAERLNTSQQQISRLESPAYQGHSLSTLRRVADALGAQIRVVFDPSPLPSRPLVARESSSTYRSTRSRTNRSG